MYSTVKPSLILFHQNKLYETHTKKKYIAYLERVLP